MINNTIEKERVSLQEYSDDKFTHCDSCFENCDKNRSSCNVTVIIYSLPVIGAKNVSIINVSILKIIFIIKTMALLDGISPVKRRKKTIFIVKKIIKKKRRIRMKKNK